LWSSAWALRQAPAQQTPAVAWLFASVKAQVVPSASPPQLVAAQVPEAVPQLKPVGHGLAVPQLSVHPPLSQAAAVGQLVPQAPQLAVSLVTVSQAPLQQKPRALAETHSALLEAVVQSARQRAFWQALPVAHTVPQPPQLVESEWMSLQVVPQHTPRPLGASQRWPGDALAQSSVPQAEVLTLSQLWPTGQSPGSQVTVPLVPEHLPFTQLVEVGQERP
jgi:hypothetical protein